MSAKGGRLFLLSPSSPFASLKAQFMHSYGLASLGRRGKSGLDGLRSVMSSVGMAGLSRQVPLRQGAGRRGPAGLVEVRCGEDRQGRQGGQDRPGSGWAQQASQPSQSRWALIDH